MKQGELTEDVKSVIKKAADKLSGAKRREFQAEITREYLDGSPRKAERELGWGRETVKKGIQELNTGVVFKDALSNRGNRKTEEKYPALAQDILSLFNDTAAHPVSAKWVRQALILIKGYQDDALPSEKTIRRMIDRLFMQN